MLDQNTDRMWYVIGAIVIGAAIIAMGLNIFDSSFESVDDNFANVMGVADGYITDISAQNIIRLSDLEFRGGSVVTGYSLSELDVVLDGSSRYAGLRIPQTVMEPNTKYKLSYSYEKLGGELVAFGGHLHLGFNEYTDVYVDGVLNSDSYIEEDSAFVGDDSVEHFVEVYFETDSIYPHPDASDGNSSGVSIQPNRGHAVPVHVILRNIKLIKVVD